MAFLKTKNILFHPYKVVKREKGGFLSVPVEKIIKVELKKPSPIKTTLLITFFVADLALGVLFMYEIGYVFYLLFTIPA
jgi:hypothetical protein